MDYLKVPCTWKQKGAVWPNMDTHIRRHAKDPLLADDSKLQAYVKKAGIFQL